MAASTRGHDQPLHRRDAHDLHGVEFLADLAGTEVGADGRAAGTGDEQGDDERAGLLHDGEDAGAAGERLGAQLLGQGADLEGDDGAEGDRDQGGGQDGHARDEPELLDELAELEGPPEDGPDDFGGEREQPPGLPQRAGDHAPLPAAGIGRVAASEPLA
ncbi:hypothetical protein RKD32_002317 [Streptomyces sp. SAI-195]